MSTKITEAFKAYKSIGLVPFCCPLIRTEIIKNKEKKIFKPPVEHEKITLQNCDNYKEGETICIGTGKRSNLTVIDFDNLNTYESVIKQYPELKKCKTIKTNKGYHIYFKYEPTFTNRSEAFEALEGVDIRNDGGFVFAAPTKYLLDDGGIAEYLDLGGEIIQMHQFFKDKLKIKSEKINKVKETTNEKKDTRFGILQNNNTKDYQTINKIVEDGLLDHKVSSFSDWMDVGMAMKECVDLETFDKFSQRCEEKYNKESTKKYWESIKGNKNKKLTIGSLIHWAKESPVYDGRFGKKVTRDDDSFPDYFTTREKFEQNHCKIVNKSFFIKEFENKHTIMSKQQLVVSYENLVFFVLDEQNGYIENSFIQKWLKDSQMRSYEDIACHPDSNKCPKDTYNTWKAFAMEHIKEYTPKLEELKIILNHIKIMCNNEDNVYNYFIKWIGQMIKFPEVKTICPTLISSEGAGKGTLIQLLRKMLGTEKVFECTNPSRDIWGPFNSTMAETFLVNLNELSKKDTLESEGRIKGLITDTQLIINGKGVSPYSLNSYHRFIITTNNYEPVATSKDDRRNFIIRSSDEKCGDKEYFTMIYNLLNDKCVVKTCYEYFKSLPDLENFHQLTIPRTEHHKNLIAMASSPIEMWLEDLVSTTPNSKLDKDLVYEIGTREMFKSYISYCDSNGLPTNISAQALTIRIGLLKVGGIGTKKTKNCNYRTFDMKLLRHKYKVDKVAEPNSSEF